MEFVIPILESVSLEDVPLKIEFLKLLMNSEKEKRMVQEKVMPTVSEKLSTATIALVKSTIVVTPNCVVGCNNNHNNLSPASENCYELPDDINELDIFNVDVSHVDTIAGSTFESSETNLVENTKTFTVYPRDSETPLYVPTLDSGYSLMLTYTKNYDLRVEIYEQFRVTSIMKNECSEPFITWNFYRERGNGLCWDELCQDAKEIYSQPNAGGNSEHSEALSMDLLHELYEANDVKTEMNIEYFDPNWKKCDFLCKIFDQNWGVSVTRAMSFPDPDKFTKQDATNLLTKKLRGLIIAKQGMLINDNFLKSILHIWCETPKTAGYIIEAYSELSNELRDDI